MNANDLVTKQDLIQLKEEIIQTFKEQLSQSANNQKKWLCGSEVQELLGLSPSGLQLWRINGIIPFTKLSGKIFYKASHIEAILEKNLQDNSQNLHIN